jgi:hypothetical protein
MKIAEDVVILYSHMKMYFYNKVYESDVCLHICPYEGLIIVNAMNVRYQRTGYIPKAVNS